MITEHQITLPKRWDKCHSMSVKHLRRKLRGFTDHTFQVHGLVKVEDRFVWLYQPSKVRTVGQLLDDLKPYKNFRADQLNLTVVVDHDKIVAKVRAHKAAKGRAA